MTARATPTLRRRVRNAIAVVVVAALLLFGVPLAVVAASLIRSQALAGLQRDATRGVASVPDNRLEAGSGLPDLAGTPGTRLGVYDVQGRRLGGLGPVRSALAARAGDGREHDGTDAGELAVAAPVLSDTAVAGSVRAAVPLSVLRWRVLRAWVLLLALAALVVVVALQLARRSARLISEPFEQITSAARQLGSGRYDVELPRWGIAEADAAGEALRDGAVEVDALVEHERAFVRDASHQLRTPLASLLLHLEQEPPDVSAAVERARHLETTIADLLLVRAAVGTGSCHAQTVAAEAAQRWTTSGRPVTVRTDDTPSVGVTAAALRQSLDVLIDNSIRHGDGDVTVTVEPYGDEVVVEVADQGAGFGPDAQEGTGLALVRRTVARAGGSLLYRRRAPAPRVALLLPAAHPTSKR